MDNEELKLFAFQPKGYGQYSFFVIAANEKEAFNAVEQHIQETFSSACSNPYAGFGTSSYKMTVLSRGEVIVNAND